MGTIIFSHPNCIEHDTGNAHPESPARLKAVLSGLEDKEFWGLDRRDAELIDKKIIKLVHDSVFVESIFDRVPEKGRVYLDPDTSLSNGSGEASRRAAGAAIDAIDAVIAKKHQNAFCAIRPPGHHAESSQAMGFCLFNSAAIAAYYARLVHGLKKIAIIDFDVHHGNGTQHSVEMDKDMFFGSSHQFPAYPGTGSNHETGCANNVINVQLTPGDGSTEFRNAYEKKIIPALKLFGPELLILSAGFDAHRADPLAQLNLEIDDYEWVTSKLLAVANDCADGRVVSLLEGGYNLDALRLSAQAHVRALMAFS